MAAMVIVCSMVAVSFGSYATSLFVGADAADWWDNVFTTALLVAMVAINMIGASVVARAQSAIVFLRARLLRLLRHRHPPRHRPRPPRLRRLPVLLEDRRQRRAHVLRLHGLQRDHLHRRRPARPLPRPPPGDDRRPRHHRHHLRPDRARRVRDAHRRRGRAVRPHRDRRGGTTGARRLRVHAHGRHRDALDRRRHERDALRLGEHDRDARGDGAVPVVLRAGLAPRRQGGAARHRRRGARRRQLRRPVGDRLGRERHRARALPARSAPRPTACGRAPAAAS